MREYNFQTVNQKRALILFVSLFALFFALIFSMVSLKHIFNIYVTMIFSFGIPILIFWLNRKKIKENCIAKISELNSEINIDDKLHFINFEEMKSYKIESYNGSIGLSVSLKNNEKIKLTANSNYGETKNFEEYCRDLEISIENFKKSHKNIEVERRKSFFEKKWVLYFLIIITLVLSIFVINIISQGKGFSMSLISAIAPLLVLWGGYFNEKNKRI